MQRTGSPTRAGAARRGAGGRVTSYQVARAAGVSQSAVSRCFQPNASISDATRERVLKAARELGYTPNAFARGLITQRSNLVGVIILNFTNLYYPELLFEFSRKLSQRGIRMLLFTLETESEIDDALDQIWQYRVDGVISAARLSSKQIALFDQYRVPLVFYNRAMPEAPINAVYCDNAEGERILVDGLYAAGHRRFGIIAGPDDSWVGQERTEGARNRLAQLPGTMAHVVAGDFSYDSGERGLATLIDAMDGPPDAVIAANDATAIGCIDAAREHYGLDIPEDISIVGFDGIGPARWSSYRLTTIRQPVRRMTDAAVNLLMERIAQPDSPLVRQAFSGVRVDGRSAKLGG